MSHSNRFSTALLVGVLGAALPLASTQAATNTPQEQANIKVVVDFYAALDQGDANHDLKQNIRKIAEKYLAAGYIQHAEGAQHYGQGREGFISMFEHVPAMPAPLVGAAPPPPVVALMADKDLVIRVSMRSMPGPDGVPKPTYIFNMFRLRDGKLAEHWDGASASPPGGAPPGPGVPAKPVAQPPNTSSRNRTVTQ